MLCKFYKELAVKNLILQTFIDACHMQGTVPDAEVLNFL